MNPTRTVLIGSPGPFSTIVFKELISKGLLISRVICSGFKPANSIGSVIPITIPEQDTPLDALATRLNIPVSYVSRPSELPASGLEKTENPDFVLVACFPFRLPDLLIHWPRVACLNIHPSLLPKYRGPDPIFWQLKKGELQTGVTLHELTGDLDAGPVVKQKTVAFGDGASRKEIEELLGNEGATLFSEIISGGPPLKAISRPQDESTSSYFELPSAEDYRLSPEYSARQAYNFICGTWPPLTPYTVKIAGNTWIIQKVLRYYSEDHLPGLIQRNHNDLYIQFSPGILHAHGRKV